MSGTDPHVEDVSGDTNGERLGDTDHAVQRLDCDRDFTFLSSQVASPQLRSNQMLVSTDCGFHEVASAVTSRPLPTHTALLRDKLDVLVALALRISRVRPQYRRCARRDDHVWRGIVMFSCHCLVDRFAVVCTVRDEAGDLAFNLFEQTWNFANIVGTIVGQSVRNDFTGACVDCEVELPPGPAGAAMPFFIPLASSKRLQAGAVDDQMSGSMRGHIRTPPGKITTSPAECGVIGNAEIETQQAKHAAGECL